MNLQKVQDSSSSSDSRDGAVVDHQNKNIFNLFIIPNPPGLGMDAILEMARKRYLNNNNITNSNKEHPMIGKVAVITGAAGGIGKEICHLLYNLGATVIALDRNIKGLEELQNSLLTADTTEISEKSITGVTPDRRILTLITHHEDLASVSESADVIKSIYPKIDLLVNNAGLTYNSKTCIPGQDNMKSVHGKDLAFTVNYLSHFLLTEKLLPNLSSSDHGGRIVHVTSTYHWKVDGSEIAPQTDGTVLAYESDPTKQSLKHIERSYANTKLAQIWHSKSIRTLALQNVKRAGCSSVCACPTWAATGIGGEESRDFLAQMAFPVENCGPGVTSVINAIFRTDEELCSGNAIDDGDSFVANSRIMDYLRNAGIDIWMTSKFVTQQLGWRDFIVDFCGLILLLGQRFTHDDFIMQETSPESLNNDLKQKALYQWSYREVEQWL